MEKPPEPQHPKQNRLFIKWRRDMRPPEPTPDELMDQLGFRRNVEGDIITEGDDFYFPEGK